MVSRLLDQVVQTEEGRFSEMAIVQISGHGLKAIAVAVLLLWGCIIAEKLMLRKANIEVRSALRDLKSMRIRKGSQRVSVPAPKVNRPTRPTLG